MNERAGTITVEASIDMRLGDCLDVLPTLPAESVHCCVTSPPYWGLRDYGTATWEGGSEGCGHEPPQEWIDSQINASSGLAGGIEGQGKAAAKRWFNADGSCKCGARRIDSQLGLEATPEEYVEKMVAVFREVWRVLRDDATLWLNMGDGYTSGNRDGHGTRLGNKQETNRGNHDYRPPTPNGLKPKDLIGMPWRVAFALQADGWYLRSDIIWAKKNPMPESCTDRPTKSHEYLFLLTKSKTYFYDADAIREEATDWGTRDRKNGKYHNEGSGLSPHTGLESSSTSRNKRSVWTISTQSYKFAHFATFPEALVLPCILAGTSEEGCCAECGAPWERVVEKETRQTRPGNVQKGAPDRNDGGIPFRPETTITTTGWRPGCMCWPYPDTDREHAPKPVPCTVLDPFLGSGTTAKVAHQYGRAFVGCELNQEYLELARKRFEQQRLFS